RVRQQGRDRNRRAGVVRQPGVGRGSGGRLRRRTGLRSAMKKIEEEQVRRRMFAEARLKCDATIKVFAECAKGRSVSVLWACRELNKKMNACLHQFTNSEYFEQYKQDRLATNNDSAIPS
ncbi:hypothetical protein BVRB_030920, partial [Beta vulgaris subsp. vulgaris]